MFRKSVLFFLLFSMILSLSSQNLDNPKNLGSDNPADLFTGKLTIDIPIYTVSIKGANLPISLLYKTSGIKVSQLASRVGLGWNLQAGGIIQREVRGFPDDFKGSTDRGTQIGWLYNTDGTPEDPSAANMVQDFVPSYAFNNTTEESDRSEFLKKILGDVENSNDVYDSEPDIFTFNINGRTGKFIFHPGENNNPESKNIMLIPYQNLEISYQLSSDYNKILSFTIIDENGTKYIFDEREYLKNKIAQYYLYKNGLNGYYWKSDYINNNYVSGWFLTKITSFYGDSIKLEYESERLPLDKFEYLEYRNYTLIDPPDPSTKIIINTGWPWTSFINTKRLKTIESPNCLVEFKSYHNRKDVLQPIYISTYHPKALNEIVINSTIKGHEKELKRYIFEYNYFDSQETIPENLYNDDESAKKRLKLCSVTEYSNGLYYPPYTFEYDYSNERKLPSRYSYTQDIWGYNNNIFDFCSFLPISYVYPDLSGSDRFSLWLFPGQEPYFFLDGTNRMIISGSVKSIGTLTKVTYPSGGYKRYEFESDDFRYQNYNYYGGGIRIKKIYACDRENTENLKAEFLYKEPEDITKSSSRIIAFPVYGYFDPKEWPDDPQDYNQQYYNENYIRTNFDIWNYSDDNVIVYEYVTVTKPGFGKTKYHFSVPGTYGTFIDDDGLFETFPAFYARHTEDIDGNKTVETGGLYFDYDKYPYPYLNNTNYDWNRGHILDVEEYEENNGNYSLVKKTDYIYDIFYGNGENTEIVQGLKIGFLENHHYGDNSRLDKSLFVYGKYNILTEVNKVLNSVNEYYYNQSEPIITKNYDYNLYGQLKRIDKIVNGNTYSTIKKYPFDYWDPEIQGVLSDPPDDVRSWSIIQLAQNNKIGESIEIINLTNNKVSNAVLTIFDDHSDANRILILPDEEWIFTIQEPVNDFSYSYIDTEGNLNFYCDSRYDELLFYDEYDEKGNLLTSHNKEDIYNSTIYCYNNSKPVAGIQNAYNVDSQEGVSCGFLNFESGCTDNIPDNNFWQIGDDGQIYDLDAHTGKYSCIISKSRAAWSTLRVFYPMEQDEKFIFSAWVKSLDGYIDDQGGIGYELYNINDELISSSWHWINFKDTQEKWEYIEIEIDLQELKEQLQINEDVKIKVFSVNLDEVNSFLIDDIRFCPANSIMSTGTFDPGRGKTSISDVNNITTYNYFDELGRIYLTKDDEGNILKRTTYNSSRLQIYLSPLTYDFGSVDIESTETYTYTFSIKNISDNPGNSVNVNILLKNNDDNGFEIISGGGQAILEPNSTRNITVEFDPSETQRYDCILAVETNDPLLDISANIYGLGGEIILGPQSYDYGKIAINDYSTKEFSMYNNTGVQISGTVSITGSQAFSFQEQPNFTIEDGEGIQYNVKFQPTESGSFNATLTVDFDQNYLPLESNIQGIGYVPITFDIQFGWPGPLNPQEIFETGHYKFCIINLVGNPNEPFFFKWESLDQYGNWDNDCNCENTYSCLCQIYINPFLYCDPYRPIIVRCTVSQVNGDSKTKPKEILNTGCSNF